MYFLRIPRKWLIISGITTSLGYTMETKDITSLTERTAAASLHEGAPIAKKKTNKLMLIPFYGIN